MATAHKMMDPPPPPPPPTDYTVRLDLTGVEARTLFAILHRVGGNPQLTARKHADAIYRALLEQGIDCEIFDSLVDPTHARLWFAQGSLSYVENQR